MKKIKNLLLVLILFFIGFDLVSAKSAIYEYRNPKNQSQGLRIIVDGVGNITYENIGLNYVVFRGLSPDLFMPNGTYVDCYNSQIATLHGTVRADDGNEIIYYELSPGSSSHPSDINLEIVPSNCVVDNASSGSSREIVLNCPYENDITVNFYNDKSITAIKSGFNSYPSVNLNEVPERCPGYIYYLEYENDLMISLNKANNYKKARYTGVNSTDASYQEEFGNANDVSYNNVEGMNFCSEDSVKMTLNIMGYVVFSLKMIVPLLLIIMGSLDFSKALISSDDKAIKDALGKLIRRIIAGIIVFFIPTILNYAFSLINEVSNNQANFTECSSCLFTPFNGCSYKKLGE